MSDKQYVSNNIVRLTEAIWLGKGHAFCNKKSYWKQIHNYEQMCNCKTMFPQIKACVNGISCINIMCRSYILQTMFQKEILHV